MLQGSNTVMLIPEDCHLHRRVPSAFPLHLDFLAEYIRSAGFTRCYWGLTRVFPCPGSLVSFLDKEVLLQVADFFFEGISPKELCDHFCYHPSPNFSSPLMESKAICVILWFLKSMCVTSGTNKHAVTKGTCNKVECYTQSLAFCWCVSFFCCRTSKWLQDAGLLQYRSLLIAPQGWNPSDSNLNLLHFSLFFFDNVDWLSTYRSNPECPPILDLYVGYMLRSLVIPVQGMLVLFPSPV